MSAIQVPDDVLRQLGATAGDALIEIACRLYETQRLKFDQAARLAGVPLETFARECSVRRIPVYWYTPEDLESDLNTLKAIGV